MEHGAETKTKSGWCAVLQKRGLAIRNQIHRIPNSCRIFNQFYHNHVAEPSADIFTLTHRTTMKKVIHFTFCISFLLVTVAQAADAPFVELKGHTNDVQSASFSPDGKKIVTQDGNGAVRLLDSVSGKEILAATGGLYYHANSPDGRTSSPFSPDGKRMITQDNNGTLRMWDTESGKELVLTGRFERFLLDGKKFITRDGNGNTRIWNTESGKEFTYTGRFNDFSQDAKRIITYDNNTTRIYDVDSEKEIPLSGRFERFSSDGKKILTVSRVGNTDTYQIRDAETGREFALTGSFQNFSPNGKRIITQVRNENTSRIWDTESGKELLAVTGYIQRYSQDEKKILIQDENALRIWDTESKRDFTLTGSFQEFSPDGKIIVTWDGNIHRICDGETGRELYALTGRFQTFSPDGRIIVANDGNTSRFYEAKSGKELPLSGRFQQFSPDGRKIITSDENNQRIYDAESGKEYPLTGWVEQFTQDGKRIFTRERNGTARILDTESGEELYMSSERLLGFAADGKRVVAAVDSSTARIWDLEAAANYRQAVITNALDLQAELRKNGFDSVSDFAQFGSAELKRKSQEGDALDRAETQQKIKTVLAEITPKTFVAVYTYSVPNDNAQVDLDADTSRFTMVIPSGFVPAKIENISFPLPNVTAVPNNDRSGIRISVSGNTNAYRELVRGSGNYRAKVWFTNLRTGQGNMGNNVPAADVLKIEIVKGQ